MKELIDKLDKRYNFSKVDYQRPDLTFATVDRDYAIPMLYDLLNNMGFKHLVLLTAVDYIERNVFQLTYILNNPDDNIDIGIRVEIARDNAEMESAHLLWETAATYQRELREMFGFMFTGSPGVNDDFILEGWDNIPRHRRDFDTKEYVEKTFFPRPGRRTNDPKEHMRKKLYDNWEDNDA